MVLNTNHYAVVFRSTHNWDKEVNDALVNRIHLIKIQDDQIARGYTLAEIKKLPAIVSENMILVRPAVFILYDVYRKEMIFDGGLEYISDLIVESSKWYDENTLYREVVIRKDLLKSEQIEHLLEEIK